MNDVPTTATTAPADEDETVMMSFKIAVPMKKGETFFAIMLRAQTIIEEAKKAGTVEGELVLGRRRFPLT